VTSGRVPGRPAGGGHARTRVAVVTGANRGIGRAITVALAAAGFTVAASARDPATLAGAAAEAAAVGGTAVPFARDVQDEASVAEMAAGARALGPVHTVVANAGVAGPTLPLHEEVAQTCAFLASDASAAVTGEDLNVTAGVVMY
jgi:NAD(P)-dependent dehydrogenase (short-subunit alcohol dehydrogenase family)